MPGVISLFLLGLPGLCLYDAVIGLWGWPNIEDVIQATSPARVGLVLSLLWPFGIPTGYALATVIPWMRWREELLGFIVWYMLAVKRTVAAKT